MKFIYTIVLVMDFPVIFQKVVIIPWILIFEIFVLLFKVSLILIYDNFSMSCIVALGWNKEKFSFISHSYGAHMSMAVKFFFLLQLFFS